MSIRNPMFALLAVIAAGACALHAAPAKKDNVADVDLWTLLNDLPSRMPLDPEQVQGVFGVALGHVSANEYVDFFEGGPAHLANGVDVESLDLRVHKHQPLHRLLVLSLAGRCVERSAVLSRYVGLQISDHPRDTFPDRETYWSTQLPWGKLSFGFAQGNPDCLRTVVFDTFASGQRELWTLIDTLSRRAPFTKEIVQQVLGLDLLPAENFNERLDSFKGGPLSLLDGVAVETASLRLLKDDPANQWLLSLSLAGHCVQHAQVMSRHADLQVTRSPGSAAPDAQAYWSKEEPWGRLSFGFAERNRDCLRSVLFSGPKW